MEKQFKDIKFKYEFREYQEETLKMLERNMNDKKIHIVAPPGAGKTILGLELMLRIGKKALILVPSIVIKEQWIERLKNDFINGDKEDLISGDILQPKYITIDTYQGLYSLDKRKIEITKILKENEIKTIVLDEAHHLRRKWQATLIEIVEKNNEIHSIALTATPPYDNEVEYKKYIDLCGEIDTKITVAQMVKNKCLCPHQDYIYFNIADDPDQNKIIDYKKRIKNFIEKLLNNKQFIKTIALHDYIVDTENHMDEILEEFDFFTAMISFLKERGLLEGNRLNVLNVSKFNIEMLNLILEKLIFESKTFERKIFKEDFEEIKKELINIGCIDKNNKINLYYSQKISNLLTKNYMKLNSIVDVIDIESKNLGKDLKMLIATDHIKDEYMYSAEEEIKELGIIPIFKKIINSSKLNIKVAILTGTLLIIPTEHKEEFLEIAKREYDIPMENIKISEMGINFNYSLIEILGKYEKSKSLIITKLFEACDIQVLIGTIALIGEGWDAPFINSIIMATYTSSFVTSNQLRGRAIRVDNNKKEKFANIWHLICMEQVDEGSYELGYDYDILKRRFLAYEGIDSEKKNISTGIERLNIKEKLYDKNTINLLNEHMTEYSKERKKNAIVWKESLKNYNPIVKNEININKKAKESLNTISTSSISKQFKTFITIIISFEILRIIPNIGTLTTMEILNLMIINATALGTISIIDLIKRTNRYYLKKVVKACYRMLREEKLISNESKYFINYKAENIEYGIQRGSTYEQMLFLKTVKESLDIDESSRYLITFDNHIMKIPKIFARNKKQANKFLKHIKSINKRIIYTKTEKGKQNLFVYKLKVLKYLNNKNR